MAETTVDLISPTQITIDDSQVSVGPGGEYVLDAASLVHVAAYGCLGAPCTAELLETLREVR